MFPKKENGPSGSIMKSDEWFYNTILMSRVLCVFYRKIVLSFSEQTELITIHHGAFPLKTPIYNARKII